MAEKNNEDAGLTYVKPETVKHGEVDRFGYCSWGQTKDGRWYSINYFGCASERTKERRSITRGFNAEIRWEILPRDYAAFGIKS